MYAVENKIFLKLLIFIINIINNIINKQFVLQKITQ